MIFTNLKSKNLLFVFLLFSFAVSAQQGRSLPRNMTPEEVLKMKDYLIEVSKNRGIPTPPPGAVRTMGEWEEIQALIITWAGQSTILKEIVRNTVKECKVIIVTTDSATVASSLVTANIPLDSVSFLDAPFNTIWVCDYGPTTVYKNEVDSLYIIDWTYNRPRPQDDEVPTAIADYFKLPIYEATTPPYDFVHTGGNNLQNGMGTLFSSNLVLNENPEKTEEQIDSIALTFMGINQYIKFPTLPYDGIHHLDMHMRLIDEETIFFGEYPEGISDGPQIEANIQYLQDSFKTESGNPFNIIRMPMPPDQNGRYPSSGGNYRTYTNAVFVNKTLLVPTYQEKYDTTALRIYRENLPGYNVVGINCNNIIGQLGALHCITKQVGVDNQLLIAHARLRDVEDTIQFYPVTAYIRHRSGISEANLFYKTSADSVYSEAPMMLIDTLGNIWASLIPAYPAGTEVQYYISADANDGKHQVRPIVAPEGYFKFKVLGEIANQPPTVRIINPLSDTTINLNVLHTPITFEANDIDGEIIEARLIINFEEVASFDTLPYTFDWTFPDAGTYFVHVQVMDDDSAIVYSEQIKIVVEETVSVEDGEKSEDWSLYPNPVFDELNISKNTTADNNALVRIFDPLGKKIYEAPYNQQRTQINFSKNPAGMYWIEIVDGDRILSWKIIKN